MYSKTSRDLNSHLVENFHHGTRAWVLVATQGWHIGGCKLQDVYTELFFKKLCPLCLEIILGTGEEGTKRIECYRPSDRMEERRIFKRNQSKRKD